MAARRKKEKTVTLVVPGYGLEKEFSFGHAERLLDMGPSLNGGWVLPEGGEYVYSYEDGLRLRSDKGGSAQAG